jgi:hypothetical protein
MAETATEKQARLERELRYVYRKVFGTPEGKKVLFSILQDCRFLSEAATNEEVALRNYATTLVRDRIGIKDAQGMMSLVDTMIERGK